MPVLSRQEAVTELLDGAIGAWLDGSQACAIALAGAAEGGMPKIDDEPSVFDAALAAVMKFGKCDKKDAVKILNEAHYWLKHFGESKPDQIRTDYAWAYVFRAYMQFRSICPDAELTENMIRMQAKIDEQVQPVREVLHGFGMFVQRMMEMLARALPPPAKS